MRKELLAMEKKYCNYCEKETEQNAIKRKEKEEDEWQIHCYECEICGNSGYFNNIEDLVLYFFGSDPCDIDDFRIEDVSGMEKHWIDLRLIGLQKEIECLKESRDRYASENRRFRNAISVLREVFIK